MGTTLKLTNSKTGKTTTITPRQYCATAPKFRRVINPLTRWGSDARFGFCRYCGAEIVNGLAAPARMHVKPRVTAVSLWEGENA